MTPRRPRRFRDLPLRRKLVIIGLAAAVCALVSSGVLSIIWSYFNLRNGAHNNLGVQAAVVADSLSAAAAFGDERVASDTLAALKPTPSIDGACAYDGHGRLLARYGTSARFDCPAAAPPDQDEAGWREMTIVRPITEGTRRLGTLFIRGNLGRVMAQLQLQAITLLSGSLLGLGVAILLSARLQQVIAAPILTLSATAMQVTKAGDYSLRAARRSDDEVGALVDAFNEMLATVQQRDQELQAVSRMKDEFLAAVSHELRTPLNAVLGWIQVLQARTPDEQTMKRAIESIERNARAQAKLIEDLLDVSRVISGKVELDMQPTDVVTVVEATVDAIRPAADAKGLKLFVSLLHKPRLVNGDAHRLQQIISNVLANAVKFTPAGESIEIRLEDKMTEYRVVVSDHGVGIAPEFLPYVFDRFRQADGSSTRRYGGLGLGLSIARDLVRLHQGRIEAASDGAGRGATFTIALPQLLAVPVTPVAQPPAGSIEGVLWGLSVLLVDDDRDARETGLAALRQAGADVTLAANAREALTLAAQHRYDVMVSDVGMPDEDGVMLLSRLRAGGGLNARVPAIAMTAYAGSHDQTRAVAAGFQDYITKPFEFGGLVTAVALAAGRSRPAD